MRCVCIVGFAMALLCGGCSQSQEQEVTGSTAACATRLYSAYNPKDMKQCVDVCIQCNRGVTTTCSTSCKLKGAS
jgi:hypothetical protein